MTQPSRPRGTVIVIALMVLLVLAGVAVLGVRLASNEIRSATNHRLGRLVTSVADGGSQIAVGYAAGDPIGFAAFIDSKVFAGTTLSLADLADVKDHAWDIAPGGSFGWLGAAGVTPSVVIDSDMTAYRQLPFYPGSSAGEYCSRLHTWRVSGQYGAAPTGEAVGVTDAPLFGEREVLIGAQLGPFPCAGQSQ